MSLVLVPIGVIAGLIIVVGLLVLSESALISARKWRLRDRASRGDRAAETACVSVKILSISSRQSGWESPWSERSPLFTPGWRSGGSGRSGALDTRGFLRGWSNRLRSAQSPLWVTWWDGSCPVSSPSISPKRIACWTAGPMFVFTRLVGPMAWCLESLTQSLAGLFGVETPARPAVTPEQIKSLLWEGAKAGVFEQAEHEIFKRVFRFCQRRARRADDPAQRGGLDRPGRFS